ncbi:MAG TPA: glycoside hydrolase family 44 protein, partial [Verrucomicrobiae bacterium]
MFAEIHLLRPRARGLRVGVALLAAWLHAFSTLGDQIVFDDALENGWQNWGWATLNYANPSPVHAGSASISVTLSSAWQGIQIYHPDMDSAPYVNLSLWLNGGSSGGQRLLVYGLVHLGSTNNFAQSQRYALTPLPTNAWQHFTIPLSALGVDNHTNFTGFVLQDAVGSAWPVFYADDMSLTSTNTTATNNSALVIAVDPQLNRHAISPLIYGVAFATSNELAGLNFALNRSGGNNETRYNWELNAHNLDNDWYFESYPETDPTPGGAADSHIANSFAAGAQPMITIPMIGWMPKLGPGRSILPSYSVAKYGAQTASDPWNADAGNGVLAATGLEMTNNNPNDANFPTNSAFQQNYVRHLLGRWGTATNGGVRYYILDNEYSLWFSTHRDVHPVGPTMQEMASRMMDYASMVKSNDPNALVIGPEEWGWSGYFYSGYDQQWSGNNNDYNPAHYPDRTANGGWDFIPWILNQFRQEETATGKRLLDYVTVHCYPQEGNVGTSATDTTTATLRNQTTRVFWDSSYTDPSWINSVIDLIPRLKGWVTNYYPGTKIGITEYNWGAEGDINGATAQADILGIFGQQGLDLATRWTTPATNTPTYLAMKLYRNYDGQQSAFGDVSVSAIVPDPDTLSAFAALRTQDSALTVMVINKALAGPASFSVTVTNFASSGVAQAWQVTASNAITRLPDIPYANGVITNTVPAQSITLLVLPTA